MKVQVPLILLALLSAGLAGCIGDDEPPADETVGPTGTADPSSAADPSEPNEPVRSVPPAREPVVPEDENDAVDPGPQVVVAHIDTGVNPYHRAFRDTSALAHVHPSRYIPGYPADTPALELTLDASSYDAAVAADAEVWSSVEADTLYWIPGTRIIGAISFGAGGTIGDNEEVRILDDHGHGTMTGSRAVAGMHSLAPAGRLVTIEGLSGDAVQWAADQGWIDVQTNSWGSLVPHPATEAVAPGIADAFGNAATKMVTIAASGNGAGFFRGFTPWPTYITATAPPGVLLVGAHDNGYVTAWSGSPPHVVADGFRPWAALRDSLDEMAPTPFACCTSTSAPYAAGAAARIILEARAILGDHTVGPVDGVLAEGPENLVDSAPLDDGRLTLDELRELLFSTAQRRPVATEDDGDAHWFSQPGDTPADPTNPGGNPYCPGCWSTFVPWSEVPEDAPTYPFIGYGAINVFSAELATKVLLGLEGMPDRSEEDTFYAEDQALRAVVYP